MEIISHRGLWKNQNEKNTEQAFANSFKLGYGTETDVRDYDGRLVISHDIANKNSFSLDYFLELYKANNCQRTLALNIKADGLYQHLKSSLKKYQVENYFVFDASIPDMVVGLEFGLNTLARFSEYECKNLLWNKCSGIWIDRFHEQKLDLDLIAQMVNENKIAAIVSDELHGRTHHKIWSQLASLPIDILNHEKLVLCTDLPEQASEFFVENII